MIKVTIQEALSKRLKTDGHYVYLYRDDDTVFYVGQSRHPLRRFYQHMGKYRGSYSDSVGDFIIENQPESLNWQIEIYTLEECRPFMACSDGYYEGCIGNPILFGEIVNAAEVAFIELFRPCFNRIHNLKPTSLPVKYHRPKIANEGVKLG